MKEFTILGFVERCAEMVIEVEEENHHALEHVGRVIEKEAKAEIGHYQDAANPFVAWAELADATKEDRVRQGYTENDPGLRIGEMRDSIHHSVVGHEAHIGSDDEKMEFFELGTSKQPPRSVLGGSLVRKTDKVVEILGHAVVCGLVGGGVVGGRLEIDD